MNARVISPPLLIAAFLAVTACGTDAKDHDAPMPGDAAAYTGCPSTIVPFAPGEVVKGDSGVLQLVVAGSSPTAPATFTNSWTLEVQDADGDRVDDATLTKLETYMPVHGHAGQPPPSIENAGDGGTLRVNLSFQMRGPWEVRFDVTSPTAGSDHVVFGVCVPE